MGEVALRRALEMSGLDASSLDAIYLVTTTPDQVNFCHDAVQLHRRLGCRPDTHALVVDSGCGGALYVVDMARRMILSDTARTIAVVASTFASAYVDREIFTCAMPENQRINAFLSMYMFGDGAGALILRGDDRPGVGILASTSGTGHQELVVHRGGGANLPSHTRATLADHAFYINGPAVADAYPLLHAEGGRRAGRHPARLGRAHRPLLPPPGQQAGAGPVRRQRRDPVRSGAGPRQPLRQHLRRQHPHPLRGGSRAGAWSSSAAASWSLFAAVGAGVHYGAQLVRL